MYDHAAEYPFRDGVYCHGNIGRDNGNWKRDNSLTGGNVTINLTPQNWMTTVGGLLAMVSGAFLASGIMVSVQWQHIIGFVGAIGVGLIGMAAKDAGTHSTQAQVAAATAKADAPPKP
jgi:hypothetical protein